MPAEAAQIILDNSGTHFDPVLVGIFKELIDDFASIALNKESGSPDSRAEARSR
jgi:HD-GYP domain-containing protein (c-di-GMP phosphodiesterase class II)